MSRLRWILLIAAGVVAVPVVVGLGISFYASCQSGQIPGES